MNSIFEQNKLADARAAALKSATERFNKWLALKGWQPGEAIIRVFQEEMGDRFFTGTNEDFDYVLRTSRATIKPSAAPTPEETKAALIKRICDLLKSPTGDGREGRYTHCGGNTSKCLHSPGPICNIHNLRYQLQSWGIQKLTAKLEEIVSKQTQSKMSVGELHQIVRAAQPERRADGFPRLPETLVPPGQIQAVRCDSAYLLGLARLDFYEYKRLVSRYGSTQITERQQAG